MSVLVGSNGFRSDGGFDRRFPAREKEGFADWNFGQTIDDRDTSVRRETALSGFRALVVSTDRDNEPAFRVGATTV